MVGKQSISYQKGHDKTRSGLFKGFVMVFAVVHGKLHQLWFTVKGSRVQRINTSLLHKLENEKNLGSHNQVPVTSV